MLPIYGKSYSEQSLPLGPSCSLVGSEEKTPTGALSSHFESLMLD